MRDRIRGEVAAGRETDEGNSRRWSRQRGISGDEGDKGEVTFLRAGDQGHGEPARANRWGWGQWGRNVTPGVSSSGIEAMRHGGEDSGPERGQEKPERTCSQGTGAKSLWSRLTLCDPPGSSVHGIPQARILEWVVVPSSRASSRPRDRTLISYDSCIGRRVLLPLAPPGKPLESGDSCQRVPWPQKEMEPQILRPEHKCRAPSCGISWEPISRWISTGGRQLSGETKEDNPRNLERFPCLGHTWDQSLQVQWKEFSFSDSDWVESSLSQQRSCPPVEMLYPSAFSSRSAVYSPALHHDPQLLR